MSVANLFVPNNYHIYAKTFSVENFDAEHITTDDITFNGSNQQALSINENDATVVLAMTGALTGNTTVHLTRVGRLVMCEFADAFGTAAGGNLTLILTALPARFIKGTVTEIDMPMFLKNNAASIVGVVNINHSTGVLTFNTTAGNGFQTGGGDSGIFGGCLSWRI